MSDQSQIMRFRFESNSSGNYVGILSDSTVVNGNLVSQNAGSSNIGIYYQVGGGGLNHVFDSALNKAGQLSQVNASLKTKYDVKYGDGAYQADAMSGRVDRLTSLLINLRPGASGIGGRAVGMIYSVGPVLGAAGITNRAQYAQIYTDAIAQIAAANANENASIEGMRITMLSTGIYAQSVDDPQQLISDSAQLIVEGVANGVAANPSHGPITILINASSDHGNKEHTAFAAVSSTDTFNISPVQNGFDVTLS